ncbi:MAG: GNAT family N-acetyltransferase [Candidatus Thorarchaeota archaeon]|nr:MAG: GNAT family N-acetyltransferase [Candidatus Thorarchaeota archaeon]
MLDQLSANDLDTLDDVLGRFIESQATRVTLDNLKEQLDRGMSEGSLELFGEKQSDEVVGLVAVGLSSNRIGLLFSGGNEAMDTHLFEFAYDRMRKRGGPIRVGGSWLTRSLIDYALNRGFTRFDRDYMIVERKTLEAIVSHDLPDGYTFANYDSHVKDSVADLIHRSHKGALDVILFPELFGSLEACSLLLRNTQDNRYGQYSSHSKILKHDGKVVGVILLSVVRENRGYIPDICIDPDYRRQGLGRLLMVHSLKHLLANEEWITGVNLDVTIGNYARNLYESLGFVKERGYPVLVMEGQ